jgi:hypothetical protein
MPLGAFSKSISGVMLRRWFSAEASQTVIETLPPAGTFGGRKKRSLRVTLLLKSRGFPEEFAPQCTRKGIRLLAKFALKILMAKKPANRL